MAMRAKAAGEPKQKSEVDAISHDFDVLDAIGRQHTSLAIAQMRGRVEETLRGWFAGGATRDIPEDESTRIMAMALDLAMFTPSFSGSTPVDRHVRGAKPEDAVDREALTAFGRAAFRLVGFESRPSDERVALRDLVTKEELILADTAISVAATGMRFALRLCPLASGRHALIGPYFALDDDLLALAMTFVRPGKGLANAHRCAAALYRHAARHGTVDVPLYARSLDEFLQDAEEALTPAQTLALRWLELDEGEPADELLADTRLSASVDNLVDAVGCRAQTDDADAPEGLAEAFERVAEIMMETLVRRDSAGLSRHRGALDTVAADIDRYITSGAMPGVARPIFDRLRSRLAFAPSPTTDAARGDLDRVIQRIQALRAKTVDQGCTEEEALAAARKVAELLDRYGLTLNAVNIGEQPCEGIGVDTDRRRSAPVDSCVPTVATFCDCRAWGEKTAAGTFRYIFFGLSADVAAACYLYELIERTFETETASFRSTSIYRELAGGERRQASNSFQIGLADGIIAKLTALKAERRTATTSSSGFDLVPAKASVVEDELDKLGIGFTTKTSSRSSRVLGPAYRAGAVAGQRFEPHRRLDAGD